MKLYHYRSIESAIKELEYGTFHFATRNELNDPMEGYVRIFWQGDKAAWEGILRNYICSLSEAIDMYLLQGNEDMLHHRTLIIDLNRFDNIPLGGILKKLGDKFLEDEEVQKIVTFYDKAMATNPDAKPLFHSDRGFQYISKVFQSKLREHEMVQAMSRVGHCIDNGPTEGFGGIIKTETYQMYTITDESSLRYAITDYIRFYSEERPQDRYHCKTSLEIRTEALSTEHPEEYLIPHNKRIKKYKEKWCA